MLGEEEGEGFEGVVEGAVGAMGFKEGVVVPEGEMVSVVVQLNPTDPPL